MRYDTDMSSHESFYTDANGRQVLERRRDYRPSYNYTAYENVSGNYYPVVSHRSEGGSGTHDGSVELMVHRRTLHDDAGGVGEPINEVAFGTGLVIRGQHYLIFESPEASAVYHRTIAQHLFTSLLSTYVLPNVSYVNYSNNYRQTWSALSERLPSNVHLLTFDRWTSKTYLVRVEHYFELNEDATFSRPVQFDLQILFNSL